MTQKSGSSASLKNASAKNSFDLLRLIAATAVLFSHEYTFFGQEEPMLLGEKNLGHCSVIVFFILSGWLIYKSWSRDPEIKSFLKKRCLRIFPALVAATLLTVFVIGPLVTEFSPSTYFSDSRTWKYLLNAFLIPQYPLPGVFSHNLYPDVVNGSLWTLPAEFTLYLSVLGLGVTGFFTRPQFLYPLVVLMAVAASVAAIYFSVNLQIITELLFVFWLGALIGIKKRGSWITALVAFSIYAGVGFFIGPASWPRGALVGGAVALVIAASKTAWGSKVTHKMGDWSYGVYIYAFPVQQTLVHVLGTEHYSIYVHMGISLLITYALSGLSWNVIEKKFIQKKTALPSA